MQQKAQQPQVNQYTLYSYFRSSTSWRVRIVLNHKKIPYNMKFIHLVKKQQNSQQYKKINPNAAVPALILKTGEILIQSMAIIQFLQQVHPQYPLFPHFDPIIKAQIRGFCQVINSGIHPYQNLRLLNKVNQKFNADKIQFAKQWVIKGMELIQEMLKKSRKQVKQGENVKYCFGNQITLADVFFVPQVQGAVNRFGVEIEKYPICKEVLNNLNKIEAFQLAEPKNQPDFEK